jgi:cytochrome c biogenesis protein
LLILGIFAMLYVRERRLWVWLAPQGAGAQATMALSSNRKTMDTDREFDQLSSRPDWGPSPHPRMNTATTTSR